MFYIIMLPVLPVKNYLNQPKMVLKLYPPAYKNI